MFMMNWMQIFQHKRSWRFHLFFFHLNTFFFHLICLQKIIQTHLYYSFTINKHHSCLTRLNPCLLRKFFLNFSMELFRLMIHGNSNWIWGDVKSSCYATWRQMLPWGFIDCNSKATFDYVVENALHKWHKMQYINKTLQFN